LLPEKPSKGIGEAGKMSYNQSRVSPQNPAEVSFVLIHGKLQFQLLLSGCEGKLYLALQHRFDHWLLQKEMNSEAFTPICIVGVLAVRR
jgi:hypothetical protein